MLTLAILLGGCSALLPTQLPDPNLHVLAAVPIAKTETTRRDVVLEVSVPRASPGFDTPRMAYVKTPFELDYFADNRWAEAPARMLGPLLTHALEQSGAFRAVVQAPSIVPADVRVVTELIRLQQDFTARPSRVELTVRVQLVDVRARRVLATRLLEAVETAPSEDPRGGVAAANAALRRVLEEIVDFCMTATANPPARSPATP